ncbi:unnamed protein product [Leuciscus chuanchicus]
MCRGPAVLHDVTMVASGHELYFFSGAVLSVVAGVVTDTGGGVSVLNECEVEFLSCGADDKVVERSLCGSGRHFPDGNAAMTFHPRLLRHEAAICWRRGSRASLNFPTTIAFISMAIRYRQGDRKQACSVEPLSRKCQNPCLVKDSRGSAGRLLSATPGQRSTSDRTVRHLLGLEMWILATSS